MATPLAPATVRIELVNHVLPSNNLIFEPDPRRSKVLHKIADKRTSAFPLEYFLLIRRQRARKGRNKLARIFPSLRHGRLSITSFYLTQFDPVSIVRGAPRVRL